MRASEKMSACGPGDKALARLLGLYVSSYGDGEVRVFRVPARMNILGTHIDHRGGYLNYLTIDKELLCVAGRRSDRLVRFCNLEKIYGRGEFNIDSERPGPGVEWHDFIRSARIIPGEWSNYLKASVLYLEKRFEEKKAKGVNLAFYGEIPVGSGMSSSSAIVVGSSVAFCSLNGIEIKREDLALMCGEAEWYVGTRGGSGDHAAMLMGKKNQIAHMRFFPLTAEFLPFPAEYRIVSCNSMIKAKKTLGAKDIFNERIMSYEIGMRIVRKKFPRLAPGIRYLRDINPNNLGSEEVVYGILLSLPVSITRKEVLETIPGEEIDFLFESHSEPAGGYRVRDAFLYGISECERSRICTEFLRGGDIGSFGRLMYISHDGDRVSSHLPDGSSTTWDFTVTDGYIRGLLEDLKSGCAERIERARLYNQPGAYRCSIRELDLIVDISRRVDGVKGAKLTGAGLGGSVLILVEKEKTGDLIEALNEKYYRPMGYPESAFVCKSVEGVEEI